MHDHKVLDYALYHIIKFIPQTHASQHAEVNAYRKFSIFLKTTGFEVAHVFLNHQHRANAVTARQ